MRTSRVDLDMGAIDALISALTQVGLHVRRPAEGDQIGADLVLKGPNRLITLEVKATSVADPGRINSMLQASERPASDQYSADVVVVVADEISEASRDLLRERGWGYLDRRGRLWLRTEDLIINDTDIDPQPRSKSTSAGTNPLTGRIAMGMSLWMLMHPDQSMGVRSFARELDCSPSTAHDALKRLQSASLVRPDNTPLIPELFWSVADAWKPERHYVVREPAPADDVTVFGSDEHGPHPVISNDVAAAAWGAPVVVQSGIRPDFYVPGVVLDRTVRVLGPSSAIDGRATIAAAPIRAVWMEAFDHESRSVPWLHWSLAHPVVVALDLAQDRSRGREILADWNPPEGFVRVW